MPLFRSTRITSDAFAAMIVALKGIQASADGFALVKSGVSVVLVIMEMCAKVKSNKKGCEHIAERSARLVQDIWRQTRIFNVELPVEVDESVAEINRLFEEIQKFFEGLQKENPLQRFARQDRNKGQVEEYGRLLDEAMVHFSFNLDLSMHRLHLESVVAHEKRHADVVDFSRMSEAERLLLTQIRGDVHIGKHAAVWLACGGVFFFRSQNQLSHTCRPVVLQVPTQPRFRGSQS
ncbi:hypothetical protein C8J57DRAFT_259470 [Mycena rebaudengoi]|nr:hypothetical protein C8J57DRAFT_259470 [Mycena rebaudengoi]